MTLAELSTLDSDLLAAALDAAKRREVEERLAKHPKCRCGKPAIHIAMAKITYEEADLHVDEETGDVRVGRFTDFGDVCPGETEIDDGDVWVCCKNEDCYAVGWTRLRYLDLHQTIRGL
jgi:hypothetical protein